MPRAEVRCIYLLITFVGKKYWQKVANIPWLLLTDPSAAIALGTRILPEKTLPFIHQQKKKNVTILFLCLLLHKRSLFPLPSSTPKKHSSPFPYFIHTWKCKEKKIFIRKTVFDFETSLEKTFILLSWIYKFLF